MYKLVLIFVLISGTVKIKYSEKSVKVIKVIDDTLLTKTKEHVKKNTPITTYSEPLTKLYILPLYLLNAFFKFLICNT